MKAQTIRKILIAVLGIAALVAAILLLVDKRRENRVPVPEPVLPQTPAIIEDAEPEAKVFKFEPIGLSAEGRSIDAYTFGKGLDRIFFVGGVHGGYEWNTVLLAYELIDHLQNHPEVIPENVSVTVIPAANPDGVYRVAGKEGRFTASDIKAGSNSDGRLNANNVDLNRNFDCNWKAEGIWKQKPVSGGTAPFSEPETAAIKKSILENKPRAVVFYHSQSNAIYGSMCGQGMLEETSKIMKIYSIASGYRSVETFDGYAVTGDASDWLASVGIPAISVELATHETIEWDKNLAGVEALFKYYSTK